MAIVTNAQTGFAEQLPDQAAQQALQSGSHQVPIISPDGQLGSVPADQVADALQQGFKQPAPEHLSHLLDHAKYNAPDQQIKAGLEGAAEGLLGPLAPLAERALGVKPEDIRKRGEFNPGIKHSAEAATFMGSLLLGTGEANLIAKGGAAIEKKILGTSGLKLIDAAERAAQGIEASRGLRIGAAGARGAIEGALFGTSSELSRMVQEDPNQTAEHAIANIGMSAVLGGAGGLAFGAVPEAWKALSGSKAGQWLADAKSEVKTMLNHADPELLIREQANDLYKSVNEQTERMWGGAGIKAQALEKHMPAELSEQMLGQVNKLNDNIGKVLENPNLSERMQKVLAKDADAFNAAVRDAKSSSQVFDAIQDLKQQMQQYAKFEKRLTPLSEEYGLSNAAKQLQHTARTMLEDTGVWGKAGKLQAEINKATSEFIPALRDFEKTFTEQLGGDQVISPGKISTYTKQLGKANAEIKQDKMANFVSASKEYHKQIAKAYEAAGLEAPDLAVGTHALEQSTKAIPAGAQAVRALLKHGLGDALGGGIGAAAGHLTGMPGMEIFGAMAGKSALGPWLDGVLKPLLKAAVDHPINSGPGFKAALDYANAAAKTSRALQANSNHVFDIGGHAADAPNTKDIERLGAKIQKVAENPNALLQSNNDVSHYMPNHAMSMATGVARITQYLNSLRPSTAPNMPFDGKVVASKDQEAKYNEALKVAQAPLHLLNNIKQGSITHEQIQHLNTMYPSLAQKMRNQLMDSMIEAKSKDKTIPYNTRMGVALFMGQPLDSTMTPQSMQSVRAAFVPPQPMQQPAPSRADKLSKLPASYETPDQSRQRHRTK